MPTAATDFRWLPRRPDLAEVGLSIDAVSTGNIVRQKSLD
jgi:hypothetical protein